MVPVQTLIDRSVRNMGGVHPQIKEYAVELIKQAYKEGIRVQISSGFRSFEEQAKLYGQGRASYVYNGKQYGQPGKKIVTNAKPGQSIHNYGLAIDYFLVSEDGTKSNWTVNADWRRVAAIGKSMGFEWGGDWRGFVDYPHLQYTGGLTLAQLQAGGKPTIPPLYTTSSVDEKEDEEMNQDIEALKKRVAVLEKQINNDTPDESPWAVDSGDWTRATKNGYFEGYPRRFLLREDAAKVVNLIVDNVRKFIVQPVIDRLDKLEKKVDELLDKLNKEVK